MFGAEAARFRPMHMLLEISVSNEVTQTLRIVRELNADYCIV